MKKDNRLLGTPPESDIHTTEDLSSQAENAGNMLLGSYSYDELKHVSPSEDASSAVKTKKKLSRSNNKDDMIFVATSPRKKTSWKRRLFSFAAVIVLGVATGVVLGNWYKDYVANLTNVEYPETDADYIDDESAILHAAESASSPLDLTASKNFLYANYKAQNASSFAAMGKGSVTINAAGIPISQTITSNRMFDGKAYSFESLSKGTLDVATLNLLEGSTVTTISGKNIHIDEATGNTVADWTGTKSNTSHDNYIKESGVPVYALLPYTISSKTVLNDNVEIEETELDGIKVYKYTMQLHPIYGAINYRKQVKKTSGLSGDPKFDDITITVYLDENWYFVRTEVIEHYVVPYGLAANCTGTLDIDFKFNVDVTLPEVM